MVSYQTEFYTAVEVQIPLILEAHDSHCASLQNEPCKCSLVQSEVIAIKEVKNNEVLFHIFIENIMVPIKVGKIFKIYSDFLPVFSVLFILL